MIVSEVLHKAIRQRIDESDKPLGYLTDHHLKWIKSWACLRFNHTKNIDIFMDFNSVPRSLFVVVHTPDGKMINIVRWMRYRFSLWRTRDEVDMPKHLVLDEWTIKFCRKKPLQDWEKGSHDNQPTG